MIRTLIAAVALLFATPALAQTGGTSSYSVATGSGGQLTQVYAVNNWYAPQGYTVQAGGAMATGTMYLAPFVVQRALTVSNLGVYVATAVASGNAQISLYANSATGLPTGVPLAGCSISTATAGYISCAVSFGTGALPAGVYWMAIEDDSTAGNTVRFTSVGFSSTTGGLSITGRANAAPFLGAIYAGVTTAHTFAAGTYTDLTSNSFSANSGGSSQAIVGFQVGSLQ